MSDTSILPGRYGGYIHIRDGLSLRFGFTGDRWRAALVSGGLYNARPEGEEITGHATDVIRSLLTINPWYPHLLNSELHDLVRTMFNLYVDTIVIEDPRGLREVPLEY